MTAEAFRAAARAGARIRTPYGVGVARCDAHAAGDPYAAPPIDTPDADVGWWSYRVVLSGRAVAVDPQDCAPDGGGIQPNLFGGVASGPRPGDAD